jgi:hypothetical protein
MSPRSAGEYIFPAEFRPVTRAISASPQMSAVKIAQIKATMIPSAWNWDISALRKILTKFKRRIFRPIIFIFSPLFSLFLLNKIKIRQASGRQDPSRAGLRPSKPVSAGLRPPSPEFCRPPAAKTRILQASGRQDQNFAGLRRGLRRHRLSFAGKTHLQTLSLLCLRVLSWNWPITQRPNGLLVTFGHKSGGEVFSH